MLQKLYQISANKWYWLALLVLGISSEAIALVYQYMLDYAPCVLCIHTRIWILGMILVSLLALALYKKRFGLLFSLLMMVIISAGLLERSYQLLGVERGFIMGDCSMESGLPQWFALDQWFPLVFQIQEPCGYTPELLFGITMAEALLALSVLMLLFHSVLFISTLLLKKD